MHTKTIEGLVGASTNVNLLNTPMRVFKEARRRGDTATMERAMEYAGDFSERAEKYQVKADAGMKEEAEEAREKEKLEREKAIEKRREEKEKLEDTVAESKDTKADTVEGSEDTAKPVTVKEPVIYTKTGEVSQGEQSSNISVSV
ncbi:MAG: hypothetical protein HFG34_04300 [Eubacterium sp.]|nr:hypothetical protein [Eubacterium sp.]